MITDKDIEKLKAVFATKEDLSSMEKRQNDRFATKEDLKAFATKEDLKAFATKEDLKAFATKEELKTLKAEIIEAVRETLENGIIFMLNQHEARIDRLEKHVGGFPSIA